MRRLISTLTLEQGEEGGMNPKRNRFIVTVESIGNLKGGFEG